MLSLRQSRNLWLLFMFPLVGFVLLIIGIFFNDLLALLVFPWAIVVQIISSKYRCGICGSKIDSVKVRMFGKQFNMPAILTPKFCKNCGADLSAQPSSENSSK